VANVNAKPRPEWKGPEIRWGKKLRPVSAAAFAELRWLLVEWPRRVWQRNGSADRFMLLRVRLPVLHLPRIYAKNEWRERWDSNPRPSL
jgi:hypothetical protein